MRMHWPHNNMNMCTVCAVLEGEGTNEQPIPPLAVDVIREVCSKEAVLEADHKIGGLTKPMAAFVWGAVRV